MNWDELQQRLVEALAEAMHYQGIPGDQQHLRGDARSLLTLTRPVFRPLVAEVDCDTCRGDGECPYIWQSGHDCGENCPDCGGSGKRLAFDKAAMEQWRQWMCEYPEFNDDHCYVGHPNPQPEATRLPRKHSECGYAYVIPAPKEG